MTKRFTTCVYFIFGLAVGLLVGDFLIVDSAEALDCVPQESVDLKFESSSVASDEPFWRTEFSPLDDPNLYDSRTLTNNALRSHHGWWRLEHVSAQ